VAKANIKLPNGTKITIEGNDEEVAKILLLIKLQVAPPEILLNTQTLKVEKQNAIALTQGFLKESKRYYSSIFTAHQNSISMQKDFREMPKLLTSFRGRPRRKYPLSDIGKDLHTEGYELRGKYVAILDRIFHIRDNIKIWEELCNNGVFDIWEPEAPYNSLSGKIDPMILLLRIFEIDYDFTNEITKGGYFDMIAGGKVRIIRPIIPNNERGAFSKEYDGSYYFEDIIEKIRSGVSGYLHWEEAIRDTSAANSNISDASKKELR